MKKAISIISAAAALLVGCNSTTQESPEQLSIQAVYALDVKIPANSKSAAEVVAKMQSVRLSGCPQSFVNAYKDYISAWDKLSVLEKKMYAQNMKKAASDVASYIANFNNPATVIQLKKDWPAFANEIDTTTTAISMSYTNMVTEGYKYNAVYPKPSSSIF